MHWRKKWLLLEGNIHSVMHGSGSSYPRSHENMSWEQTSKTNFKKKKSRGKCLYSCSEHQPGAPTIFTVNRRKLMQGLGHRGTDRKRFKVLNHTNSVLRWFRKSLPKLPICICFFASHSCIEASTKVKGGFKRNKLSTESRVQRSRLAPRTELQPNNSVFKRHQQ